MHAVLTLQDESAGALASHGQADAGGSGHAEQQAPLLGHNPQKVRLLACLSCLLVLHWQGGGSVGSGGGGLRYSGSAWGQAAGVDMQMGGSHGGSRRLLWEQLAEGQQSRPQQQLGLDWMWRHGVPQWARCGIVYHPCS